MHMQVIDMYIMCVLFYFLLFCISYLTTKHLTFYFNKNLGPYMYFVKYHLLTYKDNQYFLIQSTKRDHYDNRFSYFKPYTHYWALISRHSFFKYMAVFYLPTPYHGCSFPHSGVSQTASLVCSHWQQGWTESGKEERSFLLSALEQFIEPMDYQFLEEKGLSRESMDFEGCGVPLWQLS